MRLWHPAEAAEAERDAWRRRIVSEGIAQPLRQVDREWYASPLRVEGISVDAHQFMGVAKSEDWTLFGDEASRRASGAEVRIRLDSDLNPYSEGSVGLTALTLGLYVHERDWGYATPGEEAPPAEAASVAPIVASELMRSAELLISVSAVGLDLEGPSRWEATPQAPHGIVATRREILGHVLADLADPRIEVGERHFSLGPYRIHLATGIATKAGQAVEIEAQPGHGLWAPPDPLLNRIVAVVATLSRAA